MSSGVVICPQCGQADRVEKVSKLYLEGVAAGRMRRADADAAPDAQPAGLSPGELFQVSRKLAPPAGGKSSLTRPLHPDLVVLVFSGLLPFFLAGIASSQRELLVPALVLIVVSYTVYLLRRKALIARFEREQADRQEAVRRVERAIGRWMRAYYCARDEVVFEAGKDTTLPVDQLRELVF